MDKSFYYDYYQNIIQQHQKGFKLVLGGTGLGKTSGIVETIKENKDENKRFFYIANRLQLLNEMVKDLEKEKIGYCLQERDEEIIKKINPDDFKALLKNKDIAKIYTENTEFIQKNYEFIKKFEKNEEADIAKLLNERVSSIFSFFRKIIKSAAAEKNQKTYNDLVKNATVKTLFPYLDFINNRAEKRVFLVSLQKSFYGFFDGKQVINLYKLQNNAEKQETNIIFLDEFDFLENDLLTQICKDAAIEQPFSFVESFYNSLTKYKLPRVEFLENQPQIRAQLNNIISEIEILPEKYGLRYPEVNHFLCKAEEVGLRKTSIFQTRYSISNNPIFLNFQKSACYLEIATEQKKANAYALFNVVNQSVAAIIRVFKNLEFENYKIYQDLEAHCFGNSDKFKGILKQIRQRPHNKIPVGTNESKLYYNGFGLYEICELGYETDREEVELKYYSLFSTPESILLHLTRNNLVFGLSATAELNRYVKNFDLNWLKNELRIENEQGNLKEYLYYDIEQKDTLIIQQANKTKQAKRKNQTIIAIAETSNSEKVSNFIDTFVRTKKEFGTGKALEYRKKRLVHFFATLQWIAKNEAQNNTNLLFFSSYTHIQLLFDTCKNPENEAYEITKIDNSLHNCYKIDFEGKEIIVLFFDATQGKEIAQKEQEQTDYYELFLRDLPVLLITTYPSAGNGVNLFFYKDKERTQKADFSNIHLLDSPYYFFNPIDNEKDNKQTKNEKIKANIYYLAKLEKNKIITEKQFKIYLNKIRYINQFNSFYLATSDGLASRVSTYIQALGRIERVWEKMNTQNIRLDTEVYNHLQDFASKEDFYANFKRNEPYFSQNVKAMFAHILKYKLGREYEQKQQQWEGLQQIDTKCKAAIKRLLAQLNLVRANKLPAEESMKIRKEWQNLRLCALKQSFAEFAEFENDENIKIPVKSFEYKLLQKYNCTFKTDFYDHKNNCLWIQKESLNIVPSKINPDSSFNKWHLNSVFEKVKNNIILRGHFDLNRFEQGFSGKGTYFTPYFYQCVLAGAIGEEAVKAVFAAEKINLTEDDIANELYELIDLKVEGKNWYIDAKNYSEQTVSNFQLEEGDEFYHPKLNDAAFKERAKDKLQKIMNFHKQEDCKIIYINVFGKDASNTNYYDKNFNQLSNSFEKAKIIVIPNMLATEKPTDDKNYSSTFQYFIELLKYLKNG